MSHSRDPYAAFRIHDYRLYVIGWLVAMIGTRIQSIAIGWEIYQRTGEALSLGLVGLAQALPMMLLALPAGMLADRYERRRLAMFSLLGMTATSLALAGFSATQGPIPWMYALLALDATAMALGRPARVALLPQLVPAETFPNAVTWNTSLMHLASVGGPALGGFVIAFSLPGAYLIAAASSLWARFHFEPGSGSGRSRVSRSRPTGLPFWPGCSSFGISAFCSRSCHWICSQCCWAGRSICCRSSPRIFCKWARLASAIYGPRRPSVHSAWRSRMIYLPPMKRAGHALLLAVAGFGVATIFFGFSQSFILSWVMLSLTGALDNISMVVRQDAHPVADAGSDAGPGLGGKQYFHRRVERTGRL